VVDGLVWLVHGDGSVPAFAVCGPPGRPSLVGDARPPSRSSAKQHDETKRGTGIESLLAKEFREAYVGYSYNSERASPDLLRDRIPLGLEPCTYHILCHVVGSLTFVAVFPRSPRAALPGSTRGTLDG
jgi:hypothetical protein